MSQPTPLVSASTPQLTSKAVFQKKAEPHNLISKRGDPPPWRDFAQAEKHQLERGAHYLAEDKEVMLVNAALYLRRPLLVTGKAGTGKSTLAHAVAYQLGLGEVLVWPITSRSTLQQGLYHYDAVGRLQETSLAQARSADKQTAQEPPDIGRFIRLGPLGTALQMSSEARPCVLLIDEIDKSDIDLPNDLLHAFEEGQFEIPELSRLPEEERFQTVEVGLHKGRGRTKIERGHVRCQGFPFIILTSNGEREFPPAFLRRCLQLEIDPPTPPQLREIVRDRLRLQESQMGTVDGIIALFESQRGKGEMATDQLLNAVFTVLNGMSGPGLGDLTQTSLRTLS